MMLVFLLEERSAKEFLNGLLPRLLPDYIKFRCIPFEGKQDLERNIVPKIKGWCTPSTKFVVLRDQDSGDCKVIKQRLWELCTEASRTDSLIRIACHELESWYLGDLKSVELALGVSGLSKQQRNRKFRDPDSLANACEELEKITKGQYAKVAGSRILGPIIALEGNLSCSYNQFLSGIHKLIAL